VTQAVAATWARILLRRPRWHAEAEVRAEFEVAPPPAEAVATLGEGIPGRVAIDLAIVDARPSGDEANARLAIAGREGRPSQPLSAWLDRLPAFALIGRRYVRTDVE
jgi:hypothetical protein